MRMEDDVAHGGNDGPGVDNGGRKRGGFMSKFGRALSSPFHPIRSLKDMGKRHLGLAKAGLKGLKPGGNPLKKLGGALSGARDAIHGGGGGAGGARKRGGVMGMLRRANGREPGGGGGREGAAKAQAASMLTGAEQPGYKREAAAGGMRERQRAGGGGGGRRGGRPAQGQHRQPQRQPQAPAQPQAQAQPQVQAQPAQANLPPQLQQATAQPAQGQMLPASTDQPQLQQQTAQGQMLPQSTDQPPQGPLGRMPLPGFQAPTASRTQNASVADMTPVAQAQLAQATLQRASQGPGGPLPMGQDMGQRRPPPMGAMQGGPQMPGMGGPMRSFEQDFTRGADGGRQFGPGQSPPISGAMEADIGNTVQAQAAKRMAAGQLMGGGGAPGMPNQDMGGGGPAGIGGLKVNKGLRPFGGGIASLAGQAGGMAGRQLRG